ncbi:MAG TPA: CPBP family intramembrane glutamic endopeptidase [Kofleriaceae bacterium]|nr:CPBP family intramembrane glutamic endopeptidase [Kofleriaceae bacterium]
MTTSDWPAGRGDLASSLVLIFPVLLAYELGVMFVGTVSGADVVTRALFALLGSRSLYLLVHAVIAAMFLVWIWRTKRASTLSLTIALPVIMEAAIYALTLGAAISLVLRHVVGLGGSTIVSACGAGVHEELVFRLGLLSGIAAVLRGRVSPRLGIAIAFAISSPLFALAHHIGPYGEPFSMHAFAFRTLAGLAFAAIYWFRSLAHAVYAHAMYDIVVTLS